MTHSKISKSALHAVGFALAVSSGASASPLQTVRVGYSDLDLAQKKDFRLLERRLARAIEKVCGSFAAVQEMGEIKKIEQCRRAAKQKIAPQIARLSIGRTLRLSSAAIVSTERK